MRVTRPRPQRGHKLRLQFLHLQIQCKVAKFSYQLSDGTKWHAQNLVALPMEGRRKTPNSEEEAQQPEKKAATEEMEIEEIADDTVDRCWVSGNEDVWEEINGSDSLTGDQVECRSGRRCNRPVFHLNFVVRYHT